MDGLLEICLWQFIRRSNPKINGCGNCEICVPDKKNKECVGYYAIHVTVIEAV